MPGLRPASRSNPRQIILVNTYAPPGTGQESRLGRGCFFAGMLAMTNGDSDGSASGRIRPIVIESDHLEHGFLGSESAILAV